MLRGHIQTYGGIIESVSDEEAYRAVNLSPVVNTIRNPVQLEYDVKIVQ